MAPTAVHTLRTAASTSWNSTARRVLAALLLISGIITLGLDNVALAQSPSFLRIEKVPVRTADPADTSCTGDIDRSASTLAVLAGEPVTFCYFVLNDSLVEGAGGPATNVIITDDRATPDDPTDDIRLTGGIAFTDEDDDGLNDDLAAGATGIAQFDTAFPLPDDYTNVATVASAENLNIEGPDSTDSATVSVTGTRLGLSKTVTASQCPGQDELTVVAGQPYSFCLVVTNIGTESAFDLTVIDDAGTPDDPTDDLSVTPEDWIGLEDLDGDFGIDDLSVGMMAIAIVNPPLDISITNRAVASAANALPVADSASVVVTGPDLSLRKTVTLEPTCPGSKQIDAKSGDTVAYCYVVSNSGSAPAINVGLVDDAATPGDIDDDFVVPLEGLSDVDGDGEIDDLPANVSASGRVPRSVFAVGSYTNKARVEWESEAGLEGFADDTATVVVAAAGSQLSIDKTVSSSATCPGTDQLSVVVGTDVTFCIAVRNAGPDPAFDVVAFDDSATPNDTADDVQLTLAGLTDEDADGAADDLAADATATATVSTSYAVPTVVTNRAWIPDPDGDIADTATVTVTDRATLTIDKQATDGSCDEALDQIDVVTDADVTYCFQVTYSFGGSAPARDVSVIDDAGTPDDPSDDFPVPLQGLSDLDDDGQADDLAPNTSANGSVTTTFATARTVTNTATATATPDLSATDTATVDVTQVPTELTMRATVGSAACIDQLDDSITIAVSQPITYCYLVTNTGSAPAIDVVVTDDPDAPDRGGIALVGLVDADGDGLDDDLAAGAVATGERDITTPSVPTTLSRTATATATNISAVTTASTSVSVVAEAPAQTTLELTQTVSTNGTCPGSNEISTTVGRAVLWCLTLANTGDGPSFDVVVVADGATPTDTTDDYVVALTGLADLDNDGDSDDLAAGRRVTGQAAQTFDAAGSFLSAVSVSATNVQADVDDQAFATVAVAVQPNTPPPIPPTTVDTTPAISIQPGTTGQGPTSVVPIPGAPQVQNQTAIAFTGASKPGHLSILALLMVAAGLVLTIGSRRQRPMRYLCR